MKKRRTTAPFPHSYLKSILHYNPETGGWIWLRAKAGVQVGKRAGSCSRRYWTILIDGKDYYSSNLAWFYITGEWPLVQVDHINRNSRDDRWVNLRLATHGQNQTNKIYPKKSGLPRGVSKDRMDMFRARVCIQGIPKYLGTYTTAEEAHQVYLKASEFRKEFLP